MRKIFAESASDTSDAEVPQPKSNGGPKSEMFNKLLLLRAKLDVDEDILISERSMKVLQDRQSRRDSTRTNTTGSSEPSPTPYHYNSPVYPNSPQSHTTGSQHLSQTVTSPQGTGSNEAGNSHLSKATFRLANQNPEKIISGASSQSNGSKTGSEIKKNCLTLLKCITLLKV